MNKQASVKFLLALIVSAGCIASNADVFGQSWVDKLHNENPEMSNDNPGINVRHSDHFRLRWGKNNVSGITVDEDFIQMNLQNAERHWHIMHDSITSGGLGFPSPSVLWSAPDGNNYRANWRCSQTFGVVDDGGAAGGIDDGIASFGMGPWAMAPNVPTTVPYHEYGHGILIGMKGLNNTPWDGGWHEGWANFSEEQICNDLDPRNMLYSHSFFLNHGRNYYDSWLWWEHLRETSGYGLTFLNTLFTQTRGDRDVYGTSEYVFDAMTRLDTSGSADHQNAIKDQLGIYAAKNVNWDYERGDMMRQYGLLPTDPLAIEYRRCVTELVKVPGSLSTYRVPFDQAPAQGGFNVIPIALTGKNGGAYSVGVNFKPLVDGVRQSDFRCTLVAINNNGTTRYSSMWNCGTNSITLSADENRLYLVVAATPSFLPDDWRTFLYAPAAAPQAFEISLVNTSATVYETQAQTSTNGLIQVATGQGYRSSTATVDSTAYVAPNARVLGYAKVLGNARIEDFAVVSGSAQVRDNAVVSGHALVTDSAQVYGYGKVRDWAAVTGNAQVYEYGRILEHAILYHSAKLHGNATIKGITQDFATADVYGYAIKEGDCSNYADFDHGVLMRWVWGIDQLFADSQPDIAGLYAGYDFEKASPIYAMDTFGIIHGYLMGGAKRVLFADAKRSYALPLDGTSQYVELHNDVSDFKDTTIACWVKWIGTQNDQRIFSFGDGSNKYMYLTPRDTANGKVKFVISNNGTGSEQILIGATAIPADVWTHVAVTLNGNVGTLYVNGTAVAANAGMTLDPDMLRGANTLAGGNHNFIGKSPAGNYFQGSVDDFNIYSQAQASSVITTLAGQFEDRNAGPGNPIAPNPTILWYRFDEISGTTAADSSGSGKTGTVTNPTWTGGYINNCLKFNGTSTRIAVPNLGAGFEQFTIAAWVNVTSIPGGTSWDASAFAMTDGWSNGDVVAEFIGTGGGSKAGKLQFAVGNSFDVYSNTKFDSASGNQNKWVHVALVYNSVSAKIYINGALDISVSAGSQTADLSALRIGCWNGDSRFFNGKIDNFMIYNRVLTESEISRFVPYTPDTTPPTPTTATWLVAPTAVSENSITMSASKGNDGNGVEYYFKCTEGGGHDSGWISANKYTDNGLAAGTQYAFSVQMRDTLGNTGTVSTALSAITSANDTTAPTPTQASFAVAPVGISTSAITMTATKGTDANPLIEYKFIRATKNGVVLSPEVSSGWQASPTWKDTSLTSDANYTYTVQMRDGKGNTGTVSAASASTIVRDSQAPTISSVARAVWQMRPYVKTNGQLWMRARTATDPNGVQYYFHCTSGGGPDSGWQDSNEWTSAAVANGTYNYVYKVRDKSPQLNETAYLASCDVVVGNKNVYHNYALSALSGLADETLVTFSGTVTTVNTDNYIVTAGGNSIRVYPNTTNGATDSSLLNRNVNINGCLWTYTAYGKVVSFAIVTKVPFIYAITASAGSNGSISPSGSVQVTENTTQTFTMIPSTGYVVDTITVDNVAQPGPISPYTFTNVTANHTISVTFKVDPDATQIAYWKYNESTGTIATDWSGHGHTGTLASGATFAAGKLANCMSLNGTTGYLTVPDLGSQSKFTIATWIYLNTYPGDYGGIFLTDSWGSGSLHCNLASNGQYACQVLGWGTGLTSTATIPLSTWCHIVYTYDGASKTVKTYYNGSLDNTLALGTASPALMNSAKIGSWGGTSRFLNGNFDDYRIYNRALSAQEVLALYNYTGTHTISASAAVGGSISPSGAVSVNAGASQEFLITSSAGFGIASLMVDGGSVTPVTHYLFNAVTANHTISAMFARVVGMNNKSAMADSKVPGRVIKVWGKVKTLHSTASFTIDDGSGVPIVVNVNGVTLPQGFDTTKSAVVTGLMTADRIVQAQEIRITP